MKWFAAFVVLICIFPSIAHCEDFTTQAAKQALAAYKADLKAAREKYAAALDEAAKKAVEAGELDEVVRIKEVKDELNGDANGGSNAGKSAKPPRVLWKHKGGYFEKLNDGHWIERVGDGKANIFAQSTNSDQYIEITREGAIVRLFSDRVDVLLKGRRGFKTFYRGGWQERK